MFFEFKIKYLKLIFVKKNKILSELLLNEAIDVEIKSSTITNYVQLLNVLNGGILIQDVSNHAIGRTHEITDGYTSYDITSLHHQMVYPWTIKPEYFQILFKSFNTRSDYYEGDKIDLGVVVQNGEPEVVLYQVPDKPVCLGIQGHPEMMPQDRPVVKMFNKLLNSLI